MSLAFLPFSHIMSNFTSLLLEHAHKENPISLPYMIHPWSEAPAATLDHFRKVAQEELDPGPRASGSHGRGNACRDAHSFVNRWGLTWKVPLSYVDHIEDGQPCKYAFIRPLNFVKFLLEKAPELLMGGCNMDTGRSHLESFWAAYKRMHPTHRLFTESHEHRSLNNTLCIAIHGDEGRGLKKGNTTILMMETCIGVDTSKNMRVGKDSRICSECVACGPYAKKFRLDNSTAVPVVGSNLAAFQSTNLKQHPFLTKFVLAAIPKKENELINSILQEITRDFIKLFEEGVETNDGQRFFVGCVGMKGNLKWFQKVAGLTRSFNNQTGTNQKMCHECQAGDSSFPFEDHGHAPCWAPTIYSERPYMVRQVILHIPFECNNSNNDPPYERFLRRDIFHNTKQGTYRIFIASAVLLLCKLQYFNERGQSNSRDILLSRAYSHFNWFCKTTGRTAALRSFSLSFFNSPTWDTFPWVNSKGSDTAHLMAWVHTMVIGFSNAPLKADHQRIFKCMILAADAGRELLRISYSHNLWMSKACAAVQYDAFHRFLVNFNGCAFLAMHQFKFTGFGMTSKFHLLAHTKLDILKLIEDQNCTWIPNVQLFGCESNEDIIGKLSRLIRRVSSRLASARALQLYLIKCRVVHQRFRKAQKNKSVPTPVLWEPHQLKKGRASARELLLCLIFSSHLSNDLVM